MYDRTVLGALQANGITGHIVNYRPGATPPAWKLGSTVLHSPPPAACHGAKPAPIPQGSRGMDLKTRIPADKHDIAAIERATAAGA